MRRIALGTKINPEYKLEKHPDKTELSNQKNMYGTIYKNKSHLSVSY